MKTIIITISEYSQLEGCTPRYINQLINNEKLIKEDHVMNIWKSGGTWLIDVLKDWYDSKQIELAKKITS